MLITPGSDTANDIRFDGHVHAGLRTAQACDDGDRISIVPAPRWVRVSDHTKGRREGERAAGMRTAFSLSAALCASSELAGAASASDAIAVKEWRSAHHERCI